MDLTTRPDIEQYAKAAVLAGDHNIGGYVAGQLELTSKCFQQCRACESWRDDVEGVQRGTIPYPELIGLFQQLEAMPTFEHLTLTGGDPQAYPMFWHLVNELAAKPRRFTVQLNTALTREPDARWITAFDALQVSLDAVDKTIYTKIRGDKHTDPEDVIRRIEQLSHPNVKINVTVMPANINHLDALLERVLKMRAKPRKVTLLAVLGPREKRVDEFWEKYNAILRVWREDAIGFEVNADETPFEVREWTKEEHTRKNVRCYAGAISFHIKADGEVYPCCLVGGEAITTHPKMAVGNVLQESLQTCFKDYVPACDYGNPDLPCRDICQWKQASINQAASQAADTRLAIP